MNEAITPILLLAVALLVCLLAYLLLALKKEQRKRGEQERRVTHLEERQERYRRMVGVMREVMIVTDRKGNIEALKFAQVADQSRPFVRMQGRTLAQMFPTQGPELTAVAERALKNQGPEYVEFALRLGRDDHTFEGAAHPLDEKAVLLVLRDVTPERRAQESMERNLALAERIAVARADMMARISHDIRNPLTGVVGAADLLLSSPLSQEDKYFVSMILEASNQLVAMTNDLHELSTLTATSKEPAKDRVDVIELIGGVLDVLAVPAQDKGLRLVGVIVESALTMITDRRRLQRVLMNLVNNAIKFTDQGEVVVRASVKDDNLRISVRDTGVGIEKSDLSTIFESYVQAGGAEKRQQGSGLGLSITREFVASLGGSVTVESTPGQGSEFFLDLPFPPLSSREGSPRPLAGKDVLLLVRNPSESAAAQAELEALGAKIWQADSLPQALAHGQEAEFCLCVLEVKDPDAPSLGELRTAFPRTPLVALAPLALGARPDFDATWLQPVRRARTLALMEQLRLSGV